MSSAGALEVGGLLVGMMSLRMVVTGLGGGGLGGVIQRVLVRGDIGVERCHPLSETSLKLPDSTC